MAAWPSHGNRRRAGADEGDGRTIQSIRGGAHYEQPGQGLSKGAVLETYSREFREITEIVMGTDRHRF